MMDKILLSKKNAQGKLFQRKPVKNLHWNSG